MRSCCWGLNSSFFIPNFQFPPGAMAAAAAAAETPALVVLRGENEVALGSVVEVAGLQGQGGKGGEAGVGTGHSEARK